MVESVGRRVELAARAQSEFNVFVAVISGGCPGLHAMAEEQAKKGPCGSCKADTADSWILLAHGKLNAKGVMSKETWLCGLCHTGRGKFERLWKRRPDLKEPFSEVFEGVVCIAIEKTKKHALCLT